jgi:hypothetical protein
MIKKIALLLILSALIIGCSKADPKEDMVVNTKTTVVQQEVDTLEAARIEAEKIEAEKIEAARIEAEKIEAARIEAARIEAEKIEAARIKAEKLKTDYDAMNEKETMVMTKVENIPEAMEPSADSIDNVVKETIEEKIAEDETISKAVEKVVVEEPLPQKEKSSKGILFGLGALAAAVLVFFVTKKK